MTNKELLIKFFDGKNYDIAKNNSVDGAARCIDQKCTPDVLSIIAECILEYFSINQDTEKKFNIFDIWHLDFTVEYVSDIFKKPNATSMKSKNEYDKFFSQPIELLAYAGVLSKEKVGRKNFYQVIDFNILEYIALKERNALTFLEMYLEKLLKDSGIYHYFNQFFASQTASSYSILKSNFSKYIIENTKINGETECNRIFTKVLNPLAFSKNLRGSNRGRFSKDVITLDMLMYNRLNFRDINSRKPKDISRKEYASSLTNPYSETAYRKFLSNRAKNIVRKINLIYNQGLSEVRDGDNAKATQMHHIFPEHEFPQISIYCENIIALTPNQHMLKAHPNNNTYLINMDYQYLCLLSKIDVIQRHIDNDYSNYSFDNLKFVLQVGLSDNSYKDVEDYDFATLIDKINLAYNKTGIL